ncbi:MAG: shikimate dehydrogenase [Chloroflexota bacterium]
MFFALGLIGCPLEHSLSPRLHRAALQASGLEGEYELYVVPRLPAGEQEMVRMLERLRRGEMQGINVTIPHKQAVMRWLDDLTPTAQAIGAVNTIYRRDGQLLGDNTDAAGFLADLEAGLGLTAVDQDKDRHALVLGAGGAARSVAFALLQTGWRVTIARRSVANSQWVGFGGPNARLRFVSMHDLAVESYDPLVRLIVNATPVGMWPEVQGNPWPVGEPFPAMAQVYDLVYNPAETALVRAARSVGLQAMNGLGMLVEQAALAFERWTGLAAPRTAMAAAVEEVGR